MADWVLSTFKNQDADLIGGAVRQAWSAVETYITQGPERAMNQFN
jgi:PTH1 family peptidyl-tRNA hydrolase